MFTVYHSNRLDMLKMLTASLIAVSPLRDPFKTEVIVVSSPAMAKWMQIELAEHFGIAANIQFPLPASFIWQMFSNVLPYISGRNMFSKSVMIWRLMALLPRLCRQSDCAAIKEYLRDDDDKHKVYQFATRVANLFEQYLIYRPDWLIAWQHGEIIEGLGKAQYWQATLWRALLIEMEHAGQILWWQQPANLYQNFIQTLMQSQNRPPGLPDRVFIYGISALSSTYLQVLQALARHIDIHLLFINPCRYYWGDIQDHIFFTQLLSRRRRHYDKKTEKALFRNQEQTAVLFDDFEKQKIGNPLLTSWGKQGRDTLYLLAKMNGIAEVDAFVDPVGDSMLSILQHDILELEDHTVIGGISHKIKRNQGGGKRPLKLNDCSLSIHVCHSPQREVEVLHDSLLGMIEDDSTMRPRDVIVMIADIDRYVPAIQAVFGNARPSRYLPFFISKNLSSRQIHPVLSIFLRLLELPNSRLVAEHVLTFLDVPSLAARFAINERGVQLLRQWVGESGIRWGLDDDMLRELMLPATGQNTWQFGLTRMLLGYAMNSEGGNWQGVLPYDESSGLIASLVGQLAELLTRLRQWRDRLSQPRHLDDWCGCACEIIEDFFVPSLDAEAEASLALLKNQWQNLLLCGFQAGYNQPVSVTLLKDNLAERLYQNQNTQDFFAGTINFCSLISMPSIPFRVVCLLGMNDGVYPRTTLLPAGFDLMAQQPRHGDRNPRDEDRYLFLEILLSAQQRFYISFIGRTIQDNTQRHPSILVSELSDYIEQSFYLPGDEQVDEENSGNRVRSHLWQWHSRMPFAPENFLPGSKIQSFADEWLLAASADGKRQPNFIASLTELRCKSLTFDELQRFYRHPVRAWFVQRLAVSFHKTSMELAVDEPFVVDALVRYQLNERLVNALIEGKSIDRLFSQVRAAGLLPYGAFGEVYWEQQCQEMMVLSKQVRAFRLPAMKLLEIYLKLDDVTLSGWLPQVQVNGLLRWRPSTLSILDGLLLWLEHLAYCAMGGEGESQMFGIRGKWHFSALSSCQAKAFLLPLVSGYCRGLASPLLLLPRSGGAWIRHCYNQETKSIDRGEISQRRALDKLIHAWKGNGPVPGEGEDLYFQKLMPHLDQQYIEAIILIAEQYFLPPLIFNLM
ncbi:MAG: exodeoxyribonuclease V subunit gamma [Sodalis sp. (in: enterobacteria)]